VFDDTCTLLFIVYVVVLLLLLSFLHIKNTIDAYVPKFDTKQANTTSPKQKQKLTKPTMLSFITRNKKLI